MISATTFPVQQRKAEFVQKPWYARLWDRITGKKAEAAVAGPALSRGRLEGRQPAQQQVGDYQTLKGFTLGQHVLYIGETGGGKTWMSEKLAKLIGLKLYMVTFTEYTKNQDLLFFSHVRRGRQEQDRQDLREQSCSGSAIPREASCSRRNAQAVGGHRGPRTTFSRPSVPRPARTS